jgi:hypothetical protein
VAKYVITLNSEYKTLKPGVSLEVLHKNVELAAKASLNENFIEFHEH